MSAATKRKADEKSVAKPAAKKAKNGKAGTGDKKAEEEDPEMREIVKASQTKLAAELAWKPSAEVAAFVAKHKNAVYRLVLDDFLERLDTEVEGDDDAGLLHTAEDMHDRVCSIAEEMSGLSSSQ
jgi:hypothetical protein